MFHSSSGNTVFTETSRTCILHEEVLQDSSTLHYKGTHTETYPENSSPSRIQFYIQKTRSSLIDTTYRGQRDLQSRKKILHLEGKEIFEYFHSFYKTFQRHSRHFSCKTFQGHFRYSRHFRHSSHSRQYFIHPGIPPYYSILQLECIFYTSTGFHRNSTEYQLGHNNFILQRKGDVAICVKLTYSPE